MTQRRQVPVLCMVVVTALVVLGAAVTPGLAADITTPFVGKAVNGGTVTHQATGGRHVLSVSADFQVPGSRIRTGRSSTARDEFISWIA